MRQKSYSSHAKRAFLPLVWSVQAMRIAALPILFSMTNAAIAVDCQKTATPPSAKITITPDSDASSNMYHIRLPRVIGSDELYQLVFSAHEKVNGQIKEIS